MACPFCQTHEKTLAHLLQQLLATRLTLEQAQASHESLQLDLAASRAQCAQYRKMNFEQSQKLQSLKLSLQRLRDKKPPARDNKIINT